MKRQLNLLLTLLIVTAATAATVNRQQAREAAAQFALKKGAQLGTEPTTVRGRRVQAADQPLYIFNTTGGQGFIVVSGDDRTDAILGYTTQGSYDDTTVPPALQEWLDQMTVEIEALAANAPKAELQQVPIREPIAPLILTTWDQGNNYYDEHNTDGIYNIKLPTIQGIYPCTGCVATAGAQLMYYYKHPKEETKEVPGYLSYYSNADTSEPLPPIVFQWEKMKTKYNDGDAYSDAAEAVANLMLYAGYAAEMSYGIGGSSADQVKLAKGMAKFFDYNPNTWKSIERSNYSVKDWDEIIYNELYHGRPVIYDGAKYANGSGGHTFLCDGYDGAGLYHFNWGWGGSSNGYFKLQATNPDGDEQDKDGNFQPGYIFGNSAIIGIQPNTESQSDIDDYIVATAKDPGLENTTITMLLQNTNNREYGFAIGVAELKDGTLTVLDDHYEFVKESSLGDGKWWVYTFEFDVSTYGLDEGRHIIVPVSLLNGETEWKRCYPFTLYYEVNVSEDNIIVVQHPVVSLKANDYIVGRGQFAGTTLPVTVTINNNNNEDDYTAPLYLFASTDDNKGNYVYVSGSAIPANGSEDVLFYFDPDVAGTWNLWVATDASGNDESIVGHATVEIKETPTDPVRLELVDGTFTFEHGGKATYTMTVKNNGDIPYYNKIFSHLWFNWACSSENDAYTRDLEIEPGDQVTVSLTFEGLTDGEKYYIDPQYCVTYGTDNWQMLTPNWTMLNYIEPEDEPVEDNIMLELTEGTFTFENDGKAIYTMTIKNNGEIPYSNKILSHLWILGEDENWSLLSENDVYTPDLVIEPGEEVTVSLTFEGLTNGEEYCIDPQYCTTYGGNTWQMFKTNWWDIEFTYTAPAVEPDPDPVPGDTSGDGLLTAKDVTPLIEYLTGKRSELPPNADLNEDTKVDIIDIVTLISKIIELQSQD